MALVIKDRVKETTTTTGTGTLTLAGAASGFQSFAAIGNANTTYYAITDQATGDWEVGIGTYTATGTTLSRDTILASSNSGAAVTLAAGIKNVFATYPASKAAFFDDIPTDNNQLTNGAGYITGNQTITLSGDVSGSGTTSIAVTVADDSHNHVISNVDGLQTALDAKQAAATALTTSTTFGGDVSGTYNSIAVANDSHNHTTATLSGNISAFTNDAGYTTNVGDITGVTAGSGLTGGGTSGSVTVSHSDTSTMSGNYGQTGNTGGSVTQDLVVTVDGFGHVTDLQSTSVNLDGRYYTETEIGNFFSGTTAITGYSKTNWDTAYTWGNHASAGYLTGNQTITLSGDVSGSGTTAITVTVADDSHNHVISNVDGLQTALDGKSSTSHNHTLDSLSNTTITSNTSGEILKWNGTAWINNTLAEAGIQPAGSYLTGNQTITLSGDCSGSGTTSIAVTVANDSHSHSTSTITGLGALATLSSVNAATITDNSVGAAELNVTGNGTTAQYLRSDGDGSFTWATPTDTNTTYSAGSGLDLTGTTFSVEPDLRDGITHVGLDTGDFISWSNNAYTSFYVNGAEDWRMVAGGAFHADGDVIAYSATISDERLKTDIKTVENALDMVNQMRGVTFTYKKDGKKSAGVVAQELEKIFPRAIHETQLPLKAEDDKEYKVVQYDQLHALLIEAIKELTDRVEELEAQAG